MKILSLIGIFSISFLLSQTGMADTPEENFTVQIKYPLTVPENDCPRDKPWLELKEPDTSYYIPKLQYLQPLDDYLSPLTITRPEFPYETICESISDPVCDIFKIIYERDKIAEVWNNSNIVKQAKSDVNEVKTKNKEIENKNNEIKKFRNSEIMHQIIKLNNPKIERVQVIGTVDYAIHDSNSYIYDNLIAQTPFQKKALHYLYSLDHFYTLKDFQSPEKYMQNKISYNQKIKERNQTGEEKNQEIEKQNAGVMKKFYEVYTPQKLNQLLNDYDTLLKQNCVSKTIDRDLYMTLEDCEIAKENRKFIKDKEKHSRYGICKLKRQF